MGLAVGAALLGDAICAAAAPQSSSGLSQRTHRCQACVIGLLLALTLPVTVGWAVPTFGALAGVLISHILLGGLGNHLWHPALIGRAIVELLFPAQVTPRDWAFLGREHLVTGSASRAVQATDYFGFDLTTLPAGADAWLAPRPIDTLLGWFHSTGPAGVSASGLLELLRDQMPSWADTLWGHVGGGLGETCGPAILLGGLILLWRGGYPLAPARDSRGDRVRSGSNLADPDRRRRWPRPRRDGQPMVTHPRLVPRLPHGYGHRPVPLDWRRPAARLPADCR